MRCPVSTPLTGPPTIALSALRGSHPCSSLHRTPRLRPAIVATRSSEPTDAIVRVVLACVCGSDLWYYRGDSPFEPGPIGHEFIGVVEDIGRRRCDRQAGDFVIAPFAFSDGTCPHCRHVPELLPDVLEGRIDPGRLLDYETGLEGIADAYAAMDERRAIKIARPRREL